MRNDGKQVGDKTASKQRETRLRQTYLRLFWSYFYEKSILRGFYSEDDKLYNLKTKTAKNG